MTATALHDEFMPQIGKLSADIYRAMIASEGGQDMAAAERLENVVETLELALYLAGTALREARAASRKPAPTIIPIKVA